MSDTQGDERGADVLAVGERGKALDVHSEQARERVGLGVTELRELCCDLLHRAMPLAQLHTGQGRARPDRSGRGRETVGGQCRRQDRGTRGDVRICFGQQPGIALFELGVAFVGEVVDRSLAGVLGKKTQRRDGDMVVVAAHAVVTGFGQDVGAGGPTTAAHTRGRRLTRRDGTLLGEQVEVTTDGSRSQAQTRGKSRRGDRAKLGDGLPYPVSGARLEAVLAGGGPVSTVGNAVVSDKHNTSVT